MRILVVATLAIGALVTSSARADAQRQERAPRVSVAQQEALDARVALATGIVDRLTPEAKRRGFGAGWRQAALEMLLPIPSDALRRVGERAVSLDDLPRLAAGARETPEAIGSPDRDLVYSPIPPCRRLDSRFWDAGNKIRGLVMRVAAPGSDAGGSAACDLSVLLNVAPAAVRAAALNVTVLDTTDGAPGFLRAGPSASTGTSLLNWYEAGPGVQVANQGIVTTDHIGWIQIDTSHSVHIIVDIFGAFLAAEATALAVQLVSDTTTIANGQSLSLVSGTCPAGYAAVSGSCSSGTIGMELRNSALFINSWICTYRNASGATASFTSQAICARVPGR